MREDGITYNVYSDQHDPSHRWSLDLLPFIVSREDWEQIEPGIVQRAGLLSAILDDVYGEQRLLRESLLPPALVFGNPGYLRSLRGTVPVGGRFLHIVGFDLARGPDGRWWVVGQRTQAPSGLGYALQNRILMSRLFADSFRAMHVQRLASGFRRLLETLNRLAPREPNETPRIVLLTPGPYNETYFEQAYLARYLGIPLVEGNDLTVRNKRLYLRTLHGLQRVHGVLRRLDDAWCDPLELRPDSALGVPGLLQAVRAGQVLVSNAIGSAFLESHAVHGFLPARAPPAGNRPDAAGAQHVVVRRSGGPTGCTGQPGARADTRQLSGGGPLAGCGRRGPAGQPGPDPRTDRCGSGALHGAVLPALLADSNLAHERLGSARCGDPDLRDRRRRRRVARTAGRADTHRRAAEGRVDAARRQQRGHVGDHRRRGRHRHPARSPAPVRRGGQAPHRYQPGCRAPVLDGALHRANR